MGFSCWLDLTRKGNFVVRYRLPGSREKHTDRTIGKDEELEVIVGGKRKLLRGRKLAECFRQRLIDQHRLNQLGQADLSQNVPELVALWHRVRRSNNLKPNSLINAEGNMNTFLADMNVRYLGDLTHQVILDWKLKMTARGWSAHTVRGKLTVLRTFLRWLVAEKRLEKSPFGDGMMPSKKKADPKFSSPNEYMALDQALACHYPTRLVCAFAYFAGLRKAESLALDWEDIAYLADGTGEVVVRMEEAKSRDSSRVVPLDPEMMALLGSRKHGRVIQATRRQVDYYFGKARKTAVKAGLMRRDRTIHGLRSAFSINTLQRGEADLGAVQELLGHASPETTREHYAKYEKKHFRSLILRSWEKRQVEKKLAGPVQGQPIKNDGIALNVVEQHRLHKAIGNVPDLRQKQHS